MLAAFTSLAACTGSIGDPSSMAPPEIGPGPEGPESVAPVDCSGERPAGIRMIRRLTSPEWIGMLRTIYEQPDLSADLPLDAANEAGFQTDESLLLVRPRFAAAVHETAMELGVHVAANANRFAPCSEAPRTCALRYVDTFGRRLYRRPLTVDERARYEELFARMEEEGEDLPALLQWATVAMVNSPHSIYRSELGEPEGERFRLTSFELATALAFTYTGAPPSDALLDRAENGELSGQAEGELEAFATELAWNADGSASPGFRDVLSRLAQQWLRLPAIESVGKDDPAFTPEIRRAMRRETERFVESVIVEERGTYADLLLSPDTFLNSALAEFYGFPGVGGGSEVARVTRPDGTGVGLLAQGGLLAVRATNADSSPTRRGLLVRRDLLCEPVPPAPVGVDVFPETDAETTRERHQVLVDEAFCGTCHALMEPIGFAFEGFDETGRLRERDGGQPIDTSGYIATNGDDLPIDGPESLAETLVEYAPAQACMTSILGAYAAGLDPERSACLFETQADQPIVERFVALAGSPHFVERVAEVAP